MLITSRSGFKADTDREELMFANLRLVVVLAVFLMAGGGRCN
jgi:hypothetical protein